MLSVDVTILTIFALVFINLVTKPKNLLPFSLKCFRTGNLRSLYFERWSNNSLCAFVSIYGSIFDHLIEQTISECYEFNNNNKKERNHALCPSSIYIHYLYPLSMRIDSKISYKLLHQKSMNQFNFRMTTHAFVYSHFKFNFIGCKIWFRHTHKHSYSLNDLLGGHAYEYFVLIL